jgi:hypothetical protein
MFSKKNVVRTLTLTIIILTFLNIFSPLVGKNYTYKWNPSSQGNEIRLPLIEDEPDKFSIEFPCSLSRRKSDWVLDAQGGKALQIQLLPDQLVVLLENVKTNKIKKFTFEREQELNCIENLTFLNKLNSLIYTGAKKSSEIHISKSYTFPIRSWLQWNKEVPSRDVNISIETSPKVDIKNGSLKNYMNLLWLIVAILMLIVTLPKIKKFKIKFMRSEVITIFTTLFLGVVSVPKHDDGWYLLIAKSLKLDGIYSNVMFPITLPNGQIHSRLISFFATENPTIFQLRIPSLICIILIWSLFVRIIYPWLKSSHVVQLPLSIFWSIWFVYSISFLITLRPEPFIALYITLIISVALLGKKISKNSSNFLAIVIMGLALSTHQSGVTAFFAGIPLIINNLSSSYHEKQFRILGFIWGICSSLFLMFWSTSPRLLFESVRAYGKLNEIYPGSSEITSKPWEEYKRVLFLFEYDLSTGLQKYVVIQLILITVFVTYIYIFSKHRDAKNNVEIYQITLFSIIGLIFVPSKWAWYFGDFVVVYMIFVYFVFSHLLGSRKITGKYFIYIFIALPIVIGLQSGWQSNDFIVPLISNALKSSILFLNSISVIISLLVLFVLIILFYTRISTLRIFMSINLIFSTLFITPLILDAFIDKKDWTFVNQSFKGFLNESFRCGLASKSYLTPENVISVQDFAKMNEASMVILPGMYIFSPCLNFISITQGKWEMPKFISGTPIFDQQRLLVNTKIELLGCNSVDINPEWLSDNCFYSVTSGIPEMSPAIVESYIF